MLRSHLWRHTLVLGLGLFPLAASAQAPSTITPTGGQTAEQVAADQAACTNEAVALTGFHPGAPPPSATASTPAVGGRVAGAARGAAVGGMRERHTDAGDREIEDLTESAARAGAAAGGMRQRQDRREDRRDTAAADDAYAQSEAAYWQSFNSCMTNKGYTVQ
jgi:hypothetical protein